MHVRMRFLTIDLLLNILPLTLVVPSTTELYLPFLLQPPTNTIPILIRGPFKFSIIRVSGAHLLLLQMLHLGRNVIPVFPIATSNYQYTCID